MSLALFSSAALIPLLGAEAQVTDPFLSTRDIKVFEGGTTTISLPNVVRGTVLYSWYSGVNVVDESRAFGAFLKRKPSPGDLGVGPYQNKAARRFYLETDDGYEYWLTSAGTLYRHEPITRSSVLITASPKLSRFYYYPSLFSTDLFDIRPLLTVRIAPRAGKMVALLTGVPSKALMPYFDSFIVSSIPEY